MNTNGSATSWWPRVTAPTGNPVRNAIVPTEVTNRLVPGSSVVINVTAILGGVERALRA